MADKKIVVYDGNCDFCNRMVSYLRRIDRHGRFEYVARDSYCGGRQTSRSAPLTADSVADEGICRLPTLPDIDEVMLIESDRVTSGSTAVLKVLQAVGWPWSIFSVFLLVPRFLRDAIYRWVATHRGGG